MRAATGRKGAACVGSAVCCRAGDEVKDHDGGVQTSTIGGTSTALHVLLQCKSISDFLYSVNEL